MCIYKIIIYNQPWLVLLPFWPKEHIHIHQVLQPLKREIHLKYNIIHQLWQNYWNSAFFLLLLFFLVIIILLSNVSFKQVCSKSSKTVQKLLRLFTLTSWVHASRVSTLITFTRGIESRRLHRNKEEQNH